jgi:hypothetical protein
MDETELMIRFTVLSFSMLGLGAVALSAVTLVGKGNRSFAIITALATVGLGAFMWSALTEGGAIPTALGTIALVMSLWPNRRKPKSEASSL